MATRPKQNKWQCDIVASQSWELQADQSSCKIKLTLEKNWVSRITGKVRTVFFFLSYWAKKKVDVGKGYSSSINTVDIKGWGRGLAVTAGVVQLKQVVSLQKGGCAQWQRDSTADHFPHRFLPHLQTAPSTCQQLYLREDGSLFIMAKNCLVIYFQQFISNVKVASTMSCNKKIICTTCSEKILLRNLNTLFQTLPGNHCKVQLSNSFVHFMGYVV